MEMEAMDVDAPTQELDPLEPEVEMRDIDAQVPRMMEVPHLSAAVRSIRAF
jgi:hypothetical protein